MIRQLQISWRRAFPLEPYQHIARQRPDLHFHNKASFESRRLLFFFGGIAQSTGITLDHFIGER